MYRLRRERQAQRVPAWAEVVRADEARASHIQSVVLVFAANMRPEVSMEAEVLPNPWTGSVVF